MKNNLIMLVIICTLFLPISCASTKKQAQALPPGVYSDDPSVLFPCSEQTPPPDKLSALQIEYLNENDLQFKYLVECIEPAELDGILPCSKKTPPPGKLSEEQIEYLEKNNLWDRYMEECIQPRIQKIIDKADKKKKEPRSMGYSEGDFYGGCLLDIIDFLLTPY